MRGKFVETNGKWKKYRVLPEFENQVRYDEFAPSEVWIGQVHGDEDSIYAKWTDGDTIAVCKDEQTAIAAVECLIFDGFEALKKWREREYTERAAPN